MDYKCGCGEPATLRVQASSQLEPYEVGPVGYVCDEHFGKLSRFVNWELVEHLIGNKDQEKAAQPAPGGVPS
jgi:hypothetical protein